MYSAKFKRKKLIQLEMGRILIPIYSRGHPPSQKKKKKLEIKCELKLDRYIYILSYSWNRHQGSWYKSFHLYRNQKGKKKRNKEKIEAWSFALINAHQVLGDEI